MISEKKIGDVFKVTSGGTPSRKKQEYYKNGTIPWVKTGDLKGKYANEPKEYITELALANSSAKIFPKNTVLLAMYGATIGACSILKIAAATNQACGAILPSEKCDHVYLYYYLKSINKELISKGVGGAQPNISGGIIKSTKIPLPPLSQQKKIAAILDAADAYRQKTKALIFKYDELTQSLFLNMFGDPFKGDVSPLKNNISIVGGYAFKSNDFIKEGLPLIKIGTVNKGYFEIDNFSFLPKSYLSKYLKWNVKSGDILMSLTGTVGKDDYGNVEKATDHYENYLLNQRVAKLEPSNDVYLKDFLFGMFSNNKTKKELTKISRGVRQANISNRDIENLKMITPSVENQKLYISAVASIEAQKAQAQASLAQAEDLFNSLLQRAFKGELTS